MRASAGAKDAKARAPRLSPSSSVDLGEERPDAHARAAAVGRDRAERARDHVAAPPGGRRVTAISHG